VKLLKRVSLSSSFNFLLSRRHVVTLCFYVIDYQCCEAYIEV